MKKSMWFWDWIAKWYDKRARKDEDLARAIERTSTYLNAEDTVLDYACGTGVVAYKIAADVKEVHGIDASAGMIDLAMEKASQREAENVRFAQQTIFDEGLARESYDVILAFNIMHLLEDARAALKRAYALLKPGGLMVSETPCLGEAGVVLRTLLPLIGKMLGISYLKIYRISELHDLVRDGGFQILESEAPEGRIRTCFVVGRKRKHSSAWPNCDSPDR